MTNTAFLADILEQPDDDGVRLVYADWLEENGDPDRGEFIRVQIALPSVLPESDRAQQLYTRQIHLLRQHAPVWLGRLAGWVTAISADLVDALGEADGFYKGSTDGTVLFRRGFVDQVSMPAAVYVKRREELIAPHPITALCLSSPAGHLNTLARCPLSRRLRALSLWAGQLSAADVEPILDSPLLAGLRLLSLGLNPLGEPGVAVFARSPHRAALRTLRLSSCGLDPGAVHGLANASSLAGLTTLNLDGNPLGNEGALALAQGSTPACPDTLYLQDCRIGNPGAIALAQCPRLIRLTRLFLHGRNPIGNAGLAALAQSPYLANLRELYLQPTTWNMEGARALADSPYLNQLGLLHLANCAFGEPARRLLRERFGNAVVFC